MSDKKCLPGEARVQFLACLERIESMVAKGHTIKSIYRTLCSEKKISMTYRTMCTLWKKKHPKEMKKPPAAPAGQATLPAVTEHNNAPAVAAVAAEEKKSFGQDPPKEYTDII